MKNYEKIKAMSIQEMAIFMNEHANDCCSYCMRMNTGCEALCCVQGQLEWLQQEAE